MKKNILRYLTYSLVAATALTFGSCSSDDKYDVEGNPDNLVYFKAGEINSNVFTADVRHTPVGDFSNLTIKIPVYVQHPVSNATRVSVALDNSLVETYNAEKGTSYPVLPDAAIELQKSSVTLAANEYSSTDSIEAQLAENLLGTLTEPEYMTAFRIVDVNGNGKASEERGTIYVKVQTGNDYIHVSGNDEITGTIYHTPIGSMGNVSIDLPAYVSQAAKVGATATITVDNSLVQEYNAEHGTNYMEAPNGVLSIENGSVSIAQGETTSATNFKASIPTDKMEQLTKPQYLIPLRIAAKRTDGSNVEKAGVIYLIFNTEEKLFNENQTTIPGSAISPEEMLNWTVDKDEMGSVTSPGDWAQWDSGSYTIDMKETRMVTGMMLQAMYAEYGHSWYFINSAKLELSEDGSNWTNCGTATRNMMSWNGDYQVYALYGGVKARYVKVTFSHRYANYGYGLDALQIYAE